MSHTKIQNWLKEEMDKEQDCTRLRVFFDRYESDESFKNLIDFLIDAANLPSFDTLEMFEDYPTINGGNNVWLQFRDDEESVEVCLREAGFSFSVKWREESLEYEDEDGNTRSWDKDPTGAPCSVGSGEYEDPKIDKTEYELSIAVERADIWLGRQLLDMGIGYTVTSNDYWEERERSYVTYSNRYNHNGFSFKPKEKVKE